MVSDPIEGLLRYWGALGTDWQGVLVGVTIVALVGLFGVSVPW